MDPNPTAIFLVELAGRAHEVHAGIPVSRRTRSTEEDLELTASDVTRRPRELGEISFSEASSREVL